MGCRVGLKRGSKYGVTYNVTEPHKGHWGGAGANEDVLLRHPTKALRNPEEVFDLHPCTSRPVWSS